MSPQFRLALLWILGSVVLVIGALSMAGGAYVDQHYIPGNADAFYHARRILDSVMTGAPIIQFDPRIHVPEGSWITWPWGFDTLLARITALFGPFADENAASRVLMNIPVMAAPFAVAFVLLLARQLRLPTLYCAIALVAFGALPSIYSLFAVGNVDHHFAELLWLLMSLCATIRFFDATGTLAPGIVLGLVFGSAVAMQNGLFILQLVVLLPFAWRWLRGELLPGPRETRAFALSLVGATLLACVPSQPWQRGLFEFYTLSWFHVYIAVCTAGMVVLLRARPFSRRALAVAVGGAVLAALPIVGTSLFAMRFVGGGLESVEGVIEAYSPYRVYAIYGPDWSTRYTSWLMWAAFPAWLVNLYWAVRARDARLQVFAIASVLFLAMYQFQYRFGSLGVTSLLLTPLLVAHQLTDRWPARRWVLALSTLVLFVVSFVPTVQTWSVTWAKGGDPVYDRIRGVFPDLERACATTPGIALSAVSDAHWISFHTKCSVIGDVFLLTALHARKRVETETLLDLSPADLLAKRPDVKYVFARHRVEVRAPAGPGLPENPDLEEVRPYLVPLFRELLAPDPKLPPEYRLMSEIATPAGRAYARVYEIVRTPAGSP
ncbi:MAG TPA: hypothetical protein VMF52_19315 [Steroidobacteraceae bacterium]|nr:hypothetical protein [Steroidobacteraceae bacterium]